jgi:hypothetical protein
MTVISVYLLYQIKTRTYSLGSNFIMAKRTETEMYEENIVHVHMAGFSVNVRKTDKGIIVDVWERDFEGAEPLESVSCSTSRLPKE